MSGAAYTDCPCGVRFHDTDWESHWAHLEAQVTRLREALEAIVGVGKRFYSPTWMQHIARTALEGER